ncbi:serine/threonine protein phosphatase [Enterococcus cecorum]|nr:metallophosphoesterase [Enterococcus cecorum]CAI3295515.1 serine/threonine protein phosphatase [Enterococcus cecorum]CAI3312444.1 serine/threonine protein phosphatase [Enterococcus cecorum]CAI3348048.1 serine/threonine protein phosphatase [Enterococcus cecorum]CAI3349383.1 serine/threonine protein phosphatase [Enterococcus cecorum]CAI3351747.1 serine/threonine protein phosphatase [Enterococcus cecorum]
MITLKPEDRVIFLGDYVDRGRHSCQVLQTIMDFETRHPGQVTVLLGNHDEWFCDWLFEPENAYIGYAMNMGIETIESFFTEHNFQAILNSQGDAPNIHVRLQAIEEKLRENLLNAPENQKLLT